MSIESPCNKICVLDASGQTCVGCFRNLEEIGRWAELSSTERASVLAELPERRRKFEGSVRCSRCGVAFHCGANRDGDPCWCSTYRPITPTAQQGCLCPECLVAAAA